MRRIRAFLFAALAPLFLSGSFVQAGVRIGIGIGWPFCGPCWHHHCCGPRIVIAAPPVYIAPRPVYIAPAPATVYVQPAPAPVAYPVATPPAATLATPVPRTN
jgi:hypothetical protein